MSEDEPGSPSAHCDRCGAELSKHSAGCWLCSNRATTMTVSPARAASAPASASVGGNAQLRLTRNIVYVCLALLLLAALVSAPGLAISLGILAAPPVIATEVATRRAHERGKPPGCRAVISSLFAVMLIVFIATAVAFAVACAGMIAADGTSLGPPLAFLGVLAGIVAFALTVHLSVRTATKMLLKESKPGTGPGPERGMPLAQLMIFIVLLTVCASVGASEPELGIAMAVVTGPALAFAFRKRAKAKALGRPTGMASGFGNFILGAVLFLLVFAAAAISLFAVICTAGAFR